MNRRDLIEHLARQGCDLLRQGRRHELWTNPVTRRVAGVPRHRTVKRPLVRGICEQLSIPDPFAT